MGRISWGGFVLGAAFTAGLTGWAAWAVASSSTSAAAAGKVGCVDVVRIYNEYQRQKDLADEMKAKQDALQNENQQRRSAIDTAQATLDKLNVSDPTYPSRMRDLLQMQIEYKNWFDLMQADMSREIGIWTVRVYNEIVDSVKREADAGGYDMVFYRDEFEPAGFDPQVLREQIRGRKLLHFNPGTDMTAQVLEKLNTAYRALPRQPMLQIGGSAPQPAPKKP